MIITFLVIWFLLELVGSSWMLYHDYRVDNKLDRRTFLVSSMTVFVGPIILLICFGFWLQESKWLDEEVHFLKKKQKPSLESAKARIGNTGAPEFKWVTNY